MAIRIGMFLSVEFLCVKLPCNYPPMAINDLIGGQIDRSEVARYTPSGDRSYLAQVVRTHTNLAHAWNVSVCLRRGERPTACAILERVG